ncbi:MULTISPECIES: amidohydrolase [unclassified Leucobacter]|uniref:amidohydrolase n=1 Tax=unclassified Leucobacter TaxID=2621730 RepID=UPI00165E5CB5|nr:MULTISPECIES: amidohydrolase [unclassified Leucobacter]MBC9926255.1 amidohydrolase [Leucobacter sp. cx-169]
MSATLFIGNVLTLDEANPRASAVLVEGGRIAAVGEAADLRAGLPAGAEVVELGDHVLMPGLIEPHGHPTSSAVVLSEHVIDIRPVIVPTADEVMRRIRQGIATRQTGVVASGWDPLLQRGLVDPSRMSLDELAGDVPIVILHNSGHSAFFNTAAARLAGVTRETPDPAGASFVREADGELAGVALEIGAVFAVAGPLLSAAYADFGELVAAELRRASEVGVTTMGDLSWNPEQAPLIAAARQQHELTARIRGYEMSHPGGSGSVPRENGDDMVRQVGIKTWADGSPWVGNVATTFPYLTNETTASMGLEPGHHGTANYDQQQITEISRAYAAEGWQLACHAHGDLAIDSVLNAWEAVISELGLTDHRFRLEHVGAMTPAQFERAAALGVTASVFVEHVHYWGDVLVDDLFGEPGARWADAESAFAAGMRATFHNDGTVTPLEPFRNMSVAMTRLSNAGTHLDGAAGVSLDNALRAHTVNAAWQLQSEKDLGSIEVGKYADLIVIDRDPHQVSAAELADTVVLATYLAGERVFAVQTAEHSELSNTRSAD